jgi:anti-sigma factor RsiW
MNQRIHRYLDGELARDELTESELAQVAAYQAVIHRVATMRPMEQPPDLAPAVLRAIGQPESGAASRARSAAGVSRRRARAVLLPALDWLWSSRPVRVRPALLAAAVVAAVAAGAMLRGAIANEARVPRVLVQFRFDAPGAQRVQLAGDFTDWEPRYTLSEALPGVWSIVVPVDIGVHDYSFVVDGERWAVDPLAPAVDDGFGGRNNRLAVMAPETDSP